MQSIACLASLVLLTPLSGSATESYSLVINNGRVMDPETGLDAIRHIGIRGDAIATLSTAPLQGQDVIDARGLVVAPGFIDMHTHSPTKLGQYHQLFDGVTTALELEAGSYPVEEYGEKISATPLINYGASTGYLSLRLLQKDGIAVAEWNNTPWPVGFKGWMTAFRFMFQGFPGAVTRTFYETASDEELDILRDKLTEGLVPNGLGIGLPLDYASDAIDSRELNMILEVAAEHGAPVFIHIRRGVNGDPSGLREVLDAAEKTGASIHICHISHNAMRNTALFLSEIRSARSRGVDVTTEVLPYNAGSTMITAAVFQRDWQTIFGITYEDVEWAETGERFNEETFTQYQEKYPSSTVIHHYLKEEWTRQAIVEPGVIIVSDLVAMKSREQKVAPHNGAFTKVLGQYVRELGALDLMTALEKMTLLPARRLEVVAPAFANKGRIREGADADLTVFDPTTVRDQATYRDPYQIARGIENVIVNGTPVVRDGEIVEGVYPGNQILAGSI